MTERTLHLKIKIQSLVDESKNIRREARKTSGKAKWNLNHHRTSVVRPHTRLNLLAYGILRHTPYNAIERKCEEYPNFTKVGNIAKKFGVSETNIQEWVSQATQYLKGINQAA